MKYPRGNHEESQKDHRAFFMLTRPEITIQINYFSLSSFYFWLQLRSATKINGIALGESQHK